MVKNLPVNARGAGSVPGSGRSPGEGNGNLFQYSCLGNVMDKETWWDTVVHGVPKSGTKLSDTTYIKLCVCVDLFIYLSFYLSGIYSKINIRGNALEGLTQPPFYHSSSSKCSRCLGV